MKKGIKIYYAVLTLAVCFQLLSTVFTLSQNIGYGQKISLLENKKTMLEEKKIALSEDLAAKTALQTLGEETGDYISISQVTLLERNSESLALN